MIVFVCGLSGCGWLGPLGRAVGPIENPFELPRPAYLWCGLCVIACFDGVVQHLTPPSRFAPVCDVCDGTCVRVMRIAGTACDYLLGGERRLCAYQASIGAGVARGILKTAGDGTATMSKIAKRVVWRDICIMEYELSAQEKQYKRSLLRFLEEEARLRKCRAARLRKRFFDYWRGIPVQQQQDGGEISPPPSPSLEAEQDEEVEVRLEEVEEEQDDAPSCFCKVWLSAERQEMVQRLMSSTGTEDPELAREFLQDNGWQLQKAVGACLPAFEAASSMAEPDGGVPDGMGGSGEYWPPHFEDPDFGRLEDAEFGPLGDLDSIGIEDDLQLVEDAFVRIVRPRRE